MKEAKNKRAELEELKLLDLRKCDTVSDIVEGMRFCSFGARMLGEVTKSIHEMITKKEAPLAIYDGRMDNELYKLLLIMQKKGWITKVVTLEDYSKNKYAENNVLVIGGFSERFEDALYNGSKRMIFINQTNQVKPHQIKDGFYPDVVMSDPDYIVPIIYYSLVERINGEKTTVTKLISELKKFGGLAYKVSDGAETFRIMVDDKDCKVFLTMSGAMTIAKMGLVVCDMIDESMVNSVTSTGALMAHGLVESIGLKHYKHNPAHNDKLLADKKLNRVTDTLEPEENFTEVDDVINEVMLGIKPEDEMSPRILHMLIGKYLSEKHPNDRGILKSAYEKNIPVFVPAFVDSEIGNDVYVHNLERMKKGKKPIIMNLELDSKELIKQVTEAKKTAIFTIGGGVPRNWTQNVAPLIEIANDRLHLKMPEKPFSYGTRICPDPMYYGHLSGCTYSEGMSWRKMDPKGRFTEIAADATQTWPFIVKYVMEQKKINSKNL